MSLCRIVIWGASGHALVVADILRLSEKYEIIGMLDDINSSKQGTIVGGVPILGGSGQLENLRRNGTTHLIVAIGDCTARHNLGTLAAASGFVLATAIHPCATVAGDVLIGEGTVIAAGAIVNPGAQIGRNCIVNTSASVDHECVIGDAVHLGPGARLGGRTIVGPGTWIGIGATVVDRVRIGEGAIIGAGSVITKDVPDRVVVYGVPGRVVRMVGEKKNPK